MLFESFKLGDITLKNRIVMAPMTRSRASKDHTPTPMMATYYGQRASAGLIITEGVSPSANGVGYPRIPGIYSDEQVEAWKPIAATIKAKGGFAFVQLMHTGRVSHPLNMPEGSKILAPSAIALTEQQMYTDQEGLKDHPVPAEMTEAEIIVAIQEYVDAAVNSIKAGFDGVEIHAANGYLIEQFLSPGSNQRTDKWGGSIENRNRFALEIAKGTVEAIGAEKTGIRISPYGAFNGITNERAEQDEQYLALTKALNDLKLVYIHVVDHSAMGAPAVPESIKKTVKENFTNGVYITSGGYDSKEKAEADLKDGKGDLVAFGRPFISNPDLVERLKAGAELAAPDYDTFYSDSGEKGYTDYPTL